jgi:hypothetical protein
VTGRAAADVSVPRAVRVRLCIESFASTPLAPGSITLDEAKSLINMQKEATKEVMLAANMMTVVAVENAINSALGAISQR